MSYKFPYNYKYWLPRRLGNQYIIDNSLNLLEICKILLLVNSWSNENFLELLLTCACRDWMTADNVLLKTLKSVNSATDCSLAEHLGSLLE